MKKSAFSLTEIVIVIVILGIVMAGIVASKDIVTEAKVRTARSVTQTSNVRGIDGIALWLETTLEDSFDSNLDGTSSTDNSVANWYDITPDLEKSARSNAAQPTVANQPALINNAINGLPALKFDGSNDFMPNTKLKLGSNISIFAVASVQSVNSYRRIINSYNDGYFFFGTGSGNTNFAAFYGNGGGWNNTNDFGSDAKLAPNVPYILSNTLSGNTSNGYVNGVNVGTSTETNGKTFSLGYTVGQQTSGGQNWDGYIGEIIIFNRAVTDTERKQVEAYLSKKWGIKVAG